MIHSTGGEDIEIRYLVDHPEVLGSLAAGFKQQWSTHFADQSIEAIKMGFVNCCREQGLPLALVAMVGPSFAGTASLREASGTVCPGIGPWLTHLFVEPSLRCRGIGTRLIEAVEAEAIRNGFSRLHAATTRAAPVFERCGWTLLEVIQYQDDRVNVLRKTLKTPRGQ